MEAIRTIQTVTGKHVTVTVPEEFEGRKVEIIVQAVDDGQKPPSEKDESRYARYIQKQPPLSPRLQKLLDENPDILHGSVLKYEDPFEPAVPPDDWDAIRDPS